MKAAIPDTTNKPNINRMERMKMTTKSIETLFEEHQNLIQSMIRRNRPLLAALHLEDEDVAQDLSIRVLSAIERFDSERSESLAAHITCSLQYEILDMKRRYKPHGVTGVPKDKRMKFLYLDAVQTDGSIYEIPSYDDTSAFEVSELLENLSEPETEILDLKIKGFCLRRKTQTEALSGVRGKYTALYDNERRIAA